MPAAPVVPKRTQLERSTETRDRLMEATVAALAGFGYAGATTVRIQELAGMTRGRLLHHYPHRDHLLVDAIRHIASRRFDEVLERAGSFPVDGRIRPAILALWSTYDGPLFWAAVELWLASRSNEELRAVLAATEREVGHAARDVTTAVFGPELARHPDFPLVHDQLTASMRGVALTYAFEPRDRLADRHIEQWEDIVHRILADGK